MENQNKATYCPKLPWQGSDKVSLGSAMPCMQPGNYNVTDSTVLKPLSQTAFLFDAHRSTSLMGPSYPNSQTIDAEGSAELKSVDVDILTIASSAEEYRLGSGVKENTLFPKTLEFSAPFLNLESSVSRDWNHVANVEGLSASMSLRSKEMNLGSFASSRKRFILFDQIGSTGRIISHPGQYLMKEINASNMDRKVVVNNSKALIEENHIGWKVGCHENEETVVALALAALQKTRASRWSSVPFGNFDNELIPESGEGEGENTSRVNSHVLREEKASSSYSEMHEDTEDLEALLSSDNEESSTGHSPSDITGNGGNYIKDDFGDVTSGISMKRRRIDTRECAEDEVNVIPSPVKEPVKKLMTNENCLTPDISVVDTSSWEPIKPENLENVVDENYNNDILDGQRSYGKSNECRSTFSSDEQFETSRCSTRQSGLSKKSRNENIKRTVKHLRSIIPGGDGMETADVLDEAIRLVKALKQKVKRMEANRQQDVIE